jgi:Fe-S cluster assembly iron-binding protein IscA
LDFLGVEFKNTISGFEYKLKLDKERLPDDVIIEKDGASVLVDEVGVF